jgi:penicillin-binding protein 1A
MAMSSFGIRSLGKQGAYPSLALGAVEVHPLEMVQGYSVFMLHGDRATPYCINKVVGPDGSIVRSYGPRIYRNQLDPWVASQLDELLHAVVTGGTAYRALANAMPNARGKTGTTTDNKDAWFCGYQDGLVGVAWCGNMVVRNGQVYQLPMGSHMYGGTAPAYFWRDIMQQAIKKGFGSKVPDIEPPAEPERKNEEVQDPHTETQVKVIPPEETIPPEGTTGGDGAPITVPDPNDTSSAGGDGTPPVVNPAGAPPDSPTTHRDPPRRRDESDDVRVDICAESGMRATIYCPETVTRTFRRGQEPKKRCTIHGG